MNAKLGAYIEQADTRVSDDKREEGGDSPPVNKAVGQLVRVSLLESGRLVACSSEKRKSAKPHSVFQGDGQVQCLAAILKTRVRERGGAERGFGAARKAVAFRGRTQ